MINSLISTDQQGLMKVMVYLKPKEADMFGKIFKVVGKAAQLSVPMVLASVMPEALINNGVAAVVKHLPGERVNQAIPFMNLGVSSAISWVKHMVGGMDPVTAIAPAIQEGGLLAGVSTAIHQSLKIPMGSMVTNGLAAKVGPGSKFSL
jgi:hypothetical protein